MPDNVMGEAEFKAFARLENPIWIFDIARRAMWWANPAAVALWGAETLEALVARDFKADMSEATRTRLDGYLLAFEAGKELREQWTFYPKGRGAVTVACRCTGARIDDGRMALFIEGHELAREQIDEDALRSVEALRHVGAPVTLFTSDGAELFCNPAVRRAFGDVPVTLSARFVSRDEGEDVWRRALAGEVVFSEARFTTRDGPRWHSFEARPARDPVTSRPAVLMIQRDITTLVEARAGRAAAEAASAAKSQFLANMSHEIRTPLASIIGYVEEIQLGERTGAEAAEALGVIRSCARHLVNLLSDVLEHTRAESGRAAMNLRETDPAAVIDDAVAAVRDDAVERGIDVRVDLDELPRAIVTDAQRMGQVLRRVLDNAVKFTPAGHVAVTARSELGAVVIDVTDTGVGMTEAQRARAFEPFSQEDTSNTRPFGGMGLGLSISRRLAQALGGTLTIARTAPGAGSTLRLTIPATAAKPPVLTVSRFSMNPGRVSEPVMLTRLPGQPRVLVAEDNAVNRVMVTRLLQRFGARVTAVEDGVEAEAAALAAIEAGSPFDLLLLDMHMPKKDGYDVAHDLRARDYRGPIIALTAAALDEDRERCLRSGCDAHTTKPVDRRSLFQTLSSFLKAVSTP